MLKIRGVTHDMLGIEKTSKEILSLLLEAIEEVGSYNVLQVVTDTVSNCVAPGREIGKVHKHIFWSLCVVHTLNLILKILHKNLSGLQIFINLESELSNFL